MNTEKKRSPWSWIPTLYFAQGIPFIFINMVTMVLFTQLGNRCNALHRLALSAMGNKTILGPDSGYYPHKALVDSGNADMCGSWSCRYRFHTSIAK